MSGIVLGFDDGPAARAAMRWAADQAERTGADVHVVYVVSSLTEWELAAIQVNSDPMRRALEHRLRTEWSEPLRTRGIPVHTHLANGRPAEQLLAVARRVSADLIVIGMTAHGTLTELVNRNTMTELRGHATRPVVAVPEAWAAAA